MRRGAGVPHDIAYRLQPGGGSPGRGAGAGGGRGPQQYSVAPPYVERPTTARDFYMNGTQTARVIANTPSEFPGSFTVPANNLGVIRSVSILANSLLITSNILWTLRYNGTAVEGWNQLTIAPRAAGSIEVSFVPQETFIPVPEGSRISWDVTVVDAGTYQVSVTTHGWFYPTSVRAAAAVGRYGG